MQADTPDPVWAMPITSSSSWTVPSSPSRPCSATNARSGRIRGQTYDEVVADVDRDHLVPEALERVLDPRARLQRHLALERAPAL